MNNCLIKEANKSLSIIPHITCTYVTVNYLEWINTIGSVPCGFLVKERKKKEDITRRYVNRERRTHRQIWTILCSINICFNKGNESRCFILKGPNSLNHWNKENKAFIPKYTSKAKREAHLGCL